MIVCGDIIKTECLLTLLKLSGGFERAILKDTWTTGSVMSSERTYSDVAGYTTAGVTYSGGFLFYSNNPETVPETATVEGGKWLCREQVAGTGRIVTWHNNGAGGTRTSGILVYNPNSSPVTVSLSKINTTHTNGGSDVAACRQYLNNGHNVNDKSFTISANGYQMIHTMSVNSGYNYGIMMDISITSGKSVYLYDLLYTNRTDNALAAANKIGSHVRGLSGNNTTTVNLGTLKYVNKQVGFKIWGPEDTRTLNVKDSSDGVTRKLNGNFGTVAKLKLTITNESGATKNLKIGVGSVGGFLMCAAKMEENLYSRDWKKAFKINSAIDLGTVANNASVTVDFSYIVGSVGSTAIAFMVDAY